MPPKVTTLPRAAKVLPNTDVGDTLDKIAGQEVVIASVKFEGRRGRKGPYVLSIIMLGDEKGAPLNPPRIYHTGSSVMANDEGDGQLQLLAKDGNIPCVATFDKLPSSSSPGQSYWSIVPAEDEAPE